MIYEILTGLVAIVGIILTIWANHSSKVKKYLENYNEVRKQIEYYIQVAEKFEEASGAEKKKFVVDTVMGFIESNNINIGRDMVETVLEYLIDFSRKVNK